MDGPDTYARGAAGIELARQLQEHFKPRDELCKVIDEHLYRTREVRIPDAYQKTALKIRSGLPFWQTAGITAALSVNPQGFSREPVGRGDAAQQEANTIERLLEASWRRQEDEAGRALLRLFVHSVVAKGSGILKTLPRQASVWRPYYAAQQDQKALLGAPKQRGRKERDRHYNRWADEYKASGRLPYPISTTDVPPESFYYLQGEDGFRVCCEIKQVPYFEALTSMKASLGRTADGKGLTFVPEASSLALPANQWAGAMSGIRTLTMYEVWDWEECQYILEGPWSSEPDSAMQVKKIAHGYGDEATRTLRGPYFMAQGTTTASRDPAHSGVSVLYPFLDDYDLINSLLTMEHNGIFHFSGWPSFRRIAQPGEGTLPMFPGLGNAPDGEEQGESNELRWEPGQVWPFDIQAVDPPRLGMDLHTGLAEAIGRVEQVYPPILQGVTTGESGYQLNQAQHLGSLMYTPPSDNMQRALAKRAAFELFLLDRSVGESVSVWSETPMPGQREASGMLSVGPDEIKEVYRVTVELKPQTPSNDLLEVRRIGEELKLGLMSKRMAVEERGRNSDQVGQELLEEQLEEMAKPQLLARTMQELSTMDQERLMGATDAAGNVLPGGGGSELPAGAGDIFAPGMGMPEQPTPPGGMNGGVSGTPVVPGPPPDMQPLPGGG